jgi:hypothetical protein
MLSPDSDKHEHDDGHNPDSSLKPHTTLAYVVISLRVHPAVANLFSRHLICRTTGSAGPSMSRIPLPARQGPATSAGARPPHAVHEHEESGSADVAGLPLVYAVDASPML